MSLELGALLPPFKDLLVEQGFFGLLKDITTEIRAELSAWDKLFPGRAADRLDPNEDPEQDETITHCLTFDEEEEETATVEVEGVDIKPEAALRMFAMKRDNAQDSRVKQRSEESLSRPPRKNGRRKKKCSIERYRR